MAQQPFISNIQRFSVDDGPGIRTTAFFKGCNLSCAWCHNPECIDIKASIQLISRTCTSCGKCTVKCSNGCHSISADGIHSIDRNKCTTCGNCAYYCPNSAIVISGKLMTAEELIAQMIKDRRYFENSGGGFTFSGGEPMLFPEYLEAALKLAKREGIHCCVDTAGCVPFSSFEKVMPYTDIFLFDIKVWDSEIHKAATGVPNELILENLRKLCEAGASVIIRTPVVMEWNGDLDQFRHIAEFLASLGESIRLVQLLPYHAYGVGKYEALGKTSRIKDHTPPSDEFMERAASVYREFGVNIQIG